MRTKVIPSLVTFLLCAATIVVPVGAGRHAEQMPDDEPLKQFLTRLEAKCAAIADLECELRETFFKDGRPERTSRFRLFYGAPDRRKKIDLDSPAPRQAYEIGSEAWHVDHAKSLTRDVWDQPPSFIPLPFFRSGMSRKSGRLLVKRLGREDLDGEPCLHVEDRFHEYWVSERDGLLRRRLQKPFAGSIPPTVFIQEFRDLRLNPGLASDTFTVPLRGGAWLTERWHTPGAAASETGRLIPYVFPEREPEQATLTETRRDEVKRLAAAVSSLEGTFRLVRISVGTRVGPPPTGTASYVPAPSPDERPDLWKTPVETLAGTLRRREPDRISARYNVESNVYGTRPDCLAITDGVSLWESRGRELRPGLASGPVPVNVQSVAGLLSRTQSLMDSARKLREWERLFQGGERRGASMPPAAGSSRPLFQELRLPDLLYKPFDGLVPEAVRYAGDETLSGAAVWRFEIDETERHRRMTIWYGAADGVVRQWREYDWLGREVESEFHFEPTGVNKAYDDTSFRFVAEPAYREQNLDQLMEEGWSRMLKAMNVPPEDTFRQFFASPASAVRDLQGSGGAFMGYELWIRFKADEKPLLKNSESYKTGDGQPAVEWFRKCFPADRETLADSAALKYLELRDQTSGGSTGAWLLWHEKAGLFFFRTWHAQ